MGNKISRFSACFYNSRTIGGDLRNIRIIEKYVRPPTQHFFFYGTLYNKQKNLVVQLYARERHRNTWDYYIVFNGTNFTSSKIYLEKFHDNINYQDSIYLDVFDETFVIYKTQVEHIYETYF